MNNTRSICIDRSLVQLARAREPRIEAKDGANSDFEIFWRIYPHRGSFPDPKKPARLKFEAVKRDVDPAAIITGATLSNTAPRGGSSRRRSPG